jgi:hypothetical protein
MSFQLIGAGSDLSSTQTQMNKNILELKNNETTQIFKDDSGTRRVLLGKGADGFYGVKVSQEGVDVVSADLADLVFNSNNNLFKIVASGTGTVTKDALSYQGTLVIPHGLGYRPTIIAYANESYLLPSLSFAPATSGGIDAGVNVYHYWVYTDAFNITFVIDTPDIRPSGYDKYAVAISLRVKYYLIRETAN